MSDVSLYNTGHMHNASPTKPRRKLTNLELSAPARGALRRLKRERGMSFTYAVETALSLLERAVVLDPLDDAARAGLGLKPAGTVKANRRKGGAL